MITHTYSRLNEWPLSVRRTQRAYLAAVYSQAVGGRHSETAFLAELLEVTPRAVRLASRLLDSQRHDLIYDVVRGARGLTAAVKEAENGARLAARRGCGEGIMTAPVCDTSHALTGRNCWRGRRPSSRSTTRS